MKKFIYIMAFVSVAVLFSGCGQKAYNMLEAGEAPSKSKAILVGKVILTPSVNDDGGATKTQDDPLTFYALFTKGQGKKRKNTIKPNYDDDYDTFYKDIPTGEFFAVEVDEQNKISLIGLEFKIEDKSFFSKVIFTIAG